MLKQIGLKYIGDGHKKKWGAQLSDRVVVTSWGRVGHPARTKVFNFPNTLRALDYYEKKKSEKLRKGYNYRQGFGGY